MAVAGELGTVVGGQHHQAGLGRARPDDGTSTEADAVVPLSLMTVPLTDPGVTSLKVAST